LGHVEVDRFGSDPVGGLVPWVLRVNIHSQLVRLDEQLMLQPDLAESWEIADGGLTYIFRLRTGVLFHHYQELTAEDVRYTLDYYRDPANEAAQQPYLDLIDVVDTPDAYTVVVRLIEPNAAFLARGAQTMIVPGAHHAVVGDAAYARDPIGSGPFRKIEHRPGEYTLLEAFPDYYGGRPYLDYLKLSVVSDPALRAAMLHSGEADSSVWPLNPADNVAFLSEAAFTTFETADFALNHFPMNNDLPQFSDRTVRRAMLHAIDRQAIIDEVFSGLATPATANLSPALEFYYEPAAMSYPVNPDEARRLLDEAGWLPGAEGVRERDGVRLEWQLAVISGDAVRRREAELVAQRLADVGMRVHLIDTNLPTAGMRDGRLQMAVFNWEYGGAEGDPDAWQTLHSAAPDNFSRFRNARVDELLAAGLRSTDSGERQWLYWEVQRIVAEEAPFLFMMFWNTVTIFSGRVQGLPKDVLRGEQLYARCNELWIDEQPQ
jgi:peptide/nickel transport system substrate-binding protein